MGNGVGIPVGFSVGAGDGRCVGDAVGGEKNSIDTNALLVYNMFESSDFTVICKGLEVPLKFGIV